MTADGGLTSHGHTSADRLRRVTALRNNFAEICTRDFRQSEALGVLWA